ncbi:hypothetical protein AAL_04729 [Moelleriella libera RCEF 2490]|uniref:VOC domain-containing protein n=1 Tax=Moelleriella libera RCEF 2490 TaxID=1081109 RepID=A0A168BMP6_9HYPO|nr:hypothetical protein AAL_04729 [Moelleriella libera RCEF 2490]
MPHAPPAVPRPGVIPKHGTERGLGQRIAFACPGGTAEVLEWEQHFVDNGVEVTGKVDWNRGGKSVYVKDWEGHVVEIMSRDVWPIY